MTSLLDRFNASDLFASNGVAPPINFNLGPYPTTYSPGPPSNNISLYPRSHFTSGFPFENRSFSVTPFPLPSEGGFLMPNRFENITSNSIAESNTRVKSIFDSMIDTIRRDDLIPAFSPDRPLFTREDRFLSSFAGFHLEEQNLFTSISLADPKVQAFFGPNLSFPEIINGFSKAIDFGRNYRTAPRMTPLEQSITWFSGMPTNSFQEGNKYANRLVEITNTYKKIITGIQNEICLGSIKISIPLKEFSLARSSTILACDALINSQPTSLIIASSHFHKMFLSEQEVRTGKVELDKHVAEILPSYRDRRIGLVLFQNGINTSKEEFQKNFSYVRDLTPEGTTLIGLYNPTKGVVKDLGRAIFLHGFMGKQTNRVSSTKECIVSLSKALAEVSPNSSLLYIPHSEGGGIGALALSQLEGDVAARMRKSLYVTAIAPSKYFPKSLGREIINIYSDKDRVTGPLARNDAIFHNQIEIHRIFMEKKPCIAEIFLKEAFPLTGKHPDIIEEFLKRNYNIRIISSLSCDVTVGKIRVWDHSFLGDTYKKALKDIIKDLGYEVGFFEGED